MPRISGPFRAVLSGLEEWGFVIDQTILDELHIDRDTPLRITSDGKGFYVEPLPQEERNKFVEAGLRLMGIHDAAFRKLAE
jgi:hypothetical protein